MRHDTYEHIDMVVEIGWGKRNHVQYHEHNIYLLCELLMGITSLG